MRCLFASVKVCLWTYTIDVSFGISALLILILDRFEAVLIHGF
jgi:hypothetical protein